MIRFLFLCKEHARCTTLDTTLVFRVVSRHFIATQDPLQKRSIGVHLMPYFVPLEPFQVSMKQTYPIRYFRYNTHVSGGFTPFRCRIGPVAKTEYRGAFDAFLCAE